MTQFSKMYCSTSKDQLYTVSTIAMRFPQIELDTPESLYLLAQMFTNYLHSPEDISSLMYCKDCDGVEKPRPWDVFGGKLIR